MDRSESASNTWNPDDYDESHSFVHEYGGDVIELLERELGDRVLDLGCGTGHLTARLAEGDGSVVGVDSSSGMISRARDSYPELEFIHADARSLTDDIDGSFDAIFSNATLHWIPEQDMDQVLSSVTDLLRPGGQFVVEFGGRGNVETIVSAIETELTERGYEGTNPWYFPSVGEYTTRLENHDFEVRYAVLFDRPTELEGEDGLRNWLEMFGDSLLAGVPDGELDSVFSAIESRTEDTLREGQTWYADYRRLRIRAIRE